MRIHHDEAAHAADLIRLNEAWISEYFRIEDFDRALARDPMRIVRDGGALITMSDGGRVVGGCALFREGADRFQLARMTVASAERGKGRGAILIATALERAASMGAGSVSVLTNTRLAPAVHLYRKHGFVPVHEGPHPHYARCDLVMERQLAPEVGSVASGQGLPVGAS
ncbi:GNAT family N-acetyltransferase [Luteimonas sp. SDU101]|uniref:GNAT family N-acetyltransferase n=1 Tax=Luteimonas sp. SDU101 TaxID=3422593 RepID=UPI003EBDAA05